MGESMNKINSIVFVIGKLSNGGAERVISILANKFTRKCDVYIIVMSENIIDYKLNENIKIICVSEEVNRKFRIIKVMQKLLKLRKILKDIKPEVIISFLGDINIFSLLASIGMKSKIVVSERNYPIMSDYVNITKYIFNINRVLYLLADKVVFQTREIQECFPKRIQKKGIIIENPISEDLPITNYRAIKKEIVTVARINKQKNIELLIETFIDFKQVHSNYKLLIYGVGPLESFYKTKYIKYIESGEVQFCGFQKDVHSKICNSELFVLSSDVEGMPNSLMEAMSIGIPCIATDSLGGGVRAISQNGNHALISPIEDKSALLNNMLYIIEHPKKAIEMGKNARRYVRTNYNIDVIITKWENLFRDFEFI